MKELTIGEQREPRPVQMAGTAETALPEEEWYDLLPVEKKLMGYSLILGIGLLVVFIFAFGVFK